jgi:sorting nexin-29
VTGREALYAQIIKRGDKLVCNNYRGLSLLCIPYKFFTSILYDRLEPLAERIIGEYQAGFRKGRSTTDQIFPVKQILEKCWDRNTDLFQILIDFPQGFDSVDSAMTGYIMREFGIPEKSVRLVELTLENTISSVTIQMEIGSFFQVKQGLKQGNGLAPLLFNLALEYVIRKLQVDIRHTLEYKSV